MIILAENRTQIVQHIDHSLFDVVCTIHHLTICTSTNMTHKILVNRLYFPLDALHVSDCVSPSSEATL